MFQTKVVEKIRTHISYSTFYRNYDINRSQRLPGPAVDTRTNCQIAGNEHADALAKKDAKITQTDIRETSYNFIKLHLKRVFQSVYRHELET